MSHASRRLSPLALPGIVPALRIAHVSEVQALPNDHAFVALLCCPDTAARVFDILRACYVAVRARSEAPVCFVAPTPVEARSAFVDALALMPELVLTSVDIEDDVPGAVGLMRQYGARWLVWVDSPEHIARAQQIARDAGFRGAPTPIARTSEALAALREGLLGEAQIWGVEAALLSPEELVSLTARRAALVCESAVAPRENSLITECIGPKCAGPIDRAGVRNLLGINEIREPCG